MDKTSIEVFEYKKNKYKMKYKLLKQKIMSGGEIDSVFEYFWSGVVYPFNANKMKFGENQINLFTSGQTPPMSILDFVDKFKKENIQKTLYFTCNFDYTLQCNKYFGLKKEECQKNRTILVELKKDLDKIKLSYWIKNKKEKIVMIQPEQNIDGFIESLKKENKNDEIPNIDFNLLMMKELIPAYKTMW